MGFAIATGCVVGFNMFGVLTEGFHVHKVPALAFGCAIGLTVGAILYYLAAIRDAIAQK